MTIVGINYFRHCMRCHRRLPLAELVSGQSGHLYCVECVEDLYAQEEKDKRYWERLKAEAATDAAWERNR